MNQGWAELDGNGHYWPAQPPAIPPSYYAMPDDPLVSPNYEGWWARAGALAKKIWKPALKLNAVALLPLLALTVPANVMLTTEQRELQTATLDQANPPDMSTLTEFLTAAGWLLAATMVAALVSAVVTAATVRLVVLAATGQPVSLREALRTALRRGPAVIGWQILGGLLGALAFLACFLPILYVGAALMILPVVVTIERGVGIGRSFSLFHADIGASLARVGSIWAVTIGASMVLAATGTVLELTVGGTPGVVVSSLWSGLYYLVAGIYITPLLVTAYADMRARREPFSTAYLTPEAERPAA
ncbi:hypothetical protein [Actinoplanes flavus]|uniref:Membrane domain of glycerophosphoryl diester phosphodiesterase n=1 Tax=Actinoplanes flavus TaxID=2820290 RepID=A0ABS3UN54_9ACTN|nr:hypothetical protein [Actinoplanes flavus]MBO3739666.1 hypothetical protein [Actinoplanes flavus]